MRITGSAFKIAVLLIVCFSLITSCSKEDSGKNYTFLVSKDLALSYSSEYINNLVTNVAEIYPEINNLKSYVSGDVDVYRLIYKTTIKGEEIHASGLVSVPATPGQYPVICFQNGTNTVNDYAPSIDPISTIYQMIEVVASMGFIVVVPDYPGFGESSQIPHPYLIAEPTVRASIDMLFAVRELVGSDLQELSVRNEFYLIGYSQGGWATLALHKAMELNYANDFNLQGSVCGAGPYNIYLLLENMISNSYYPMPVYLGYIVNAYSAYEQFTNPVTDILNEPYASRLSSLYTGTLNFDQINSQLTTSIPTLINADFISGFATDPKYESVREALSNNSIAPWQTLRPLYFLHGENDSQVSLLVTDNIYNGMLSAGTSAEICKKEIIPGADHGDGIVPCMIKGLLFIIELSTSN